MIDCVKLLRHFLASEDFTSVMIAAQQKMMDEGCLIVIIIKSINFL